MINVVTKVQLPNRFPSRVLAALPQRLRVSIFLLAVTLMTASYCLAAQQYDGPAQLPEATVPSAMADTPAPGSIISVNAGDDLQSALNSAQCGDIIELQAGATFSGQFVVPAKN